MGPRIWLTLAQGANEQGGKDLRLLLHRYILYQFDQSKRFVVLLPQT